MRARQRDTTARIRVVQLKIENRGLQKRNNSFIFHSSRFISPSSFIHPSATSGIIINIAMEIKEKDSMQEKNRETASGSSLSGETRLLQLQDVAASSLRWMRNDEQRKLENGRRPAVRSEKMKTVRAEIDFDWNIERDNAACALYTTAQPRHFPTESAINTSLRWSRNSARDSMYYASARVRNAAVSP